MGGGNVKKSKYVPMLSSLQTKFGPSCILSLIAGIVAALLQPVICTLGASTNFLDLSVIIHFVR